MRNVPELESRLNSFDPAVRATALQELASGAPQTGPSSPNVNMHLHSFFSYNAYGWSPSRIAWEARKAGLTAAGLCDFDALDGMGEFYEAGELLGLRTCVNLETRTFVSDFADKELDSPGEPGVSYVMGAGFVRMPGQNAPEAAFIARLGATAADRNRTVIGRINARVPTIALDYERDVVPLSPSGCPTERHIIEAYVNKSLKVFAAPDARVSFWAPVLGLTPEKTADLLADRPALENLVRSKLAKKGGPGYIQPTRDTFPLLEDFFSWVRACGAVPMDSWLDGTSAGESDPAALLECSRSKGAVALNLIPDRNWNIRDEKARAAKYANLCAIIKTADGLNMPVNIGTELNRLGLPFVDDLAGEALRPFAEIFSRGARIMVGHALLSRFGGFSYAGVEAAAEFGSDIRRKNDVFEAVGALPALTAVVGDRLRTRGPEKSLAALRDSASTGTWAA